MTWLSPQLSLTKKFGGDRRIRIISDQKLELAPGFDQHSFADVENAEREVRLVSIFQHRQFAQLFPSQQLETHPGRSLFSIDRHADAPRVDDPSSQSRRRLPLRDVGRELA